MKEPGFGQFAMIAAFCLALAISSSAQTFTSLKSFGGLDGVSPYLGSLVQGADGNLYGTAAQGGANGSHGTVFEITPEGELAALYSFCSQSNCADGELPYAGLMLAANGNFYGTTTYGGAGFSSNCPSIGCGTVFEITPAGKLTTLYSFCPKTDCADGESPLAALVQGTNGNLYGTTQLGGVFGTILCPIGCGTIFQISTSGELTTLYIFCNTTQPCPDGESPNALLLAPNGNFYGTTGGGGADQAGTFFEMTPAGKLTTLFSFDRTDGTTPNALIQTADGSFYGTTAFGGANAGSNGDGAGTVFKITPKGELTTLYNFCSQTNCADGDNPGAPLVEGTDGNFYGTTIRGGANTSGANCIAGCGTVFEITPAGQLTTLYNFCSEIDCQDGDVPFAGLTQSTSGFFYGTTTHGGNHSGCDCGTTYSLSMGLGPFVEANPNFGKAGNVISILGNDLTGASSLTFNGTSATFTVVSNTLIKATVPSGATTGTIKVTTPSGTLSGNVVFRVQPQRNRSSRSVAHQLH
jgi:uncharacterized repeat protein (TIGR03803 family)